MVLYTYTDNINDIYTKKVISNNNIDNIYIYWRFIIFTSAEDVNDIYNKIVLSTEDMNSIYSKNVLSIDNIDNIIYYKVLLSTEDSNGSYKKMTLSGLKRYYEQHLQHLKRACTVLSIIHDGKNY